MAHRDEVPLPAFARASKAAVTEGDFVALRRHGGRLAAARAAFPHAPTPFVDLSTGVNPHAWRGPRATQADLSRLPDPEDTRALEAAAAAAFGVPASCVVAVPGAEAGLRLIPSLIPAKTVAIVSPTYSGHREAWAAKDVALIDRSAMAACGAEALVLVNPNNPDGVSVPAHDLRRLSRERSGWTIVDESFAEVTPEISVAHHVHDRLIVLRSFGKFYGLPGVRLGFMIAEPSIAKKARSLLGDWPVSADAIAAGLAAYPDRAWHGRAVRRLNIDARRLDRVLTKAGLQVVGGTALFRLTASADAASWFQHLGEAGILVRAFEDQPTWLRFGLPSRSQWPRLIAALEQKI